MSKHVELVPSIYETVEAGDFSVLLGALADAVEWYEAENGPYWFGGVLIGGHAVMERVFSRLPQDFDVLRLHVRRVVGCGDTVLAEARYSAIGRATGLRLDAQVAHVWDFKDGKVVRWQQYTDTRQFADVMGASSSVP
jgi:ketosteroid isomerase-like protein